MAITGKIRQKVRDGSLQEMWREAKWMFVYIRRYRAVVGIHILLGILGTVLSLLSSVAMKTLIDVVTGFQTGAIVTAAAWMAGMLLGSAGMQALSSRIAAVINIRVQNGIQARSMTACCAPTGPRSNSFAPATCSTASTADAYSGTTTP